MKLLWDIVKSTCKEFFEVIHNLKHDTLLRKFSDESNQYNLTPVYIEEHEHNKPNPKYNTVKDIASKLGNKDVRNIALTGPYGSGKSSVIQTLERDYPKAKYLNISLATLADDTLINTEHKQPATANLPHKTKDEINHLIEYSILQQIIYKEKSGKLRQSRLKRIQNISLVKVISISSLFILAVFATIILFHPKTLIIDSLCSFLSPNKSWRLVWDFLCVAYLTGFSIYAISHIIISTYNAKINKLNIKDIEIGIEKSRSIFNKHLDEIIYFFEVTKYNVVVIEDLDRFDTTHIFLKLRELNQLLNASNSINRRIVFIYAIRDDMFTNTNRTKFFDYIATVIPVINSSNACDMLRNALSSKNVSADEIDDNTCRDLGLYIDDMRILYNIVDEYLQYRKKIDDKIIAKNLLGIILYKNYCPDDFADLHYRKGTLYTIISHKKQYVEEGIKSKVKELELLEKQLAEDMTKYRLINGKELRTIYLAYYLFHINQKIMYFVDGDTKVSPQELIDNEVTFQKLVNDEFSQIEYRQLGGWTNTAIMDLNIKFKDVEKSLDSRFGYAQRLNYENDIIKTQKEEIEKLKNEVAVFQQLSLAQILNRAEITLFQADILDKDNKSHLLEFLLKKGYVNEYFYDYISYFYPGTLTPEDKDFITSLRVGRRKEYNYQLYKINSIIQELPDKSFNDGGVLNISLVKHLADHLDRVEIQSILDKVISCIKRRKEHDFVAAFYNEFPGCEVFFERLFKEWPRFDMDCLEDKKKDVNTNEVSILFEAFIRYVDLLDIDHDDHYMDPQISRNFKWLNSRIKIIGINRIKTIIQTRSICFDNILIDDANKDLMEFVSKGLYYEYSENNLKQIVSYIAPEKTKRYGKASLTVLLELNEQALLDDIKNNMSNYIRCFPETSSEENEMSLLLILKLAPIDNISKAYLSKQSKKIKDLSEIQENDRKIMALVSNIVEATWTNIKCFISTEEDNINNNILSAFIDSNIDALSNSDYSTLKDEIALNLFTHFIECNILSFPAYKKFRGCFDIVLTDTDLTNVDEERISFLIETRCIILNSYYYDFVKNQHPRLLASFIINNKEVYIDNLSNYPIDSTIAIKLLKSRIFRDAEIAQIIYSFPIEMEINSYLANLVCNLFAAGKIDVIGEQEEKLKHYINMSSSIYVKISAITHYINGWDVSDDVIKELLCTLGGNYSIIASRKGKRPRLEKTNNNKLLLESLMKKKYILSYWDKESFYIVITRNIDNT